MGEPQNKVINYGRELAILEFGEVVTSEVLKFFI